MFGSGIMWVHIEGESTDGLLQNSLIDDIALTKTKLKDVQSVSPDIFGLGPF